MADQTPLIRVVAEFARTVAHEHEIGEVLYRLTDQALDVLDIDGAGVSLDDGGRLRYVTPRPCGRRAQPSRTSTTSHVAREVVHGGLEV